MPYTAFFVTAIVSIIAVIYGGRGVVGWLALALIGLGGFRDIRAWAKAKLAYHPQPGPNSWVTGAFALVGAFILLAKLQVPPMSTLAARIDRATDAVYGSFDASGDLGTWTMAPDSCVSGEQAGFYGIIMSSDDDNRLGIKVVRPPVGETTVSVISTTLVDTAMIFRREDCPVFDIELTRDSSRWNDIWNMSGAMTLDCRVDGTRFSGHATFNYCH